MAMMCDECGERPATIRLMSIVDGEKVSRNLCAHCLIDVKKTMPNLDLPGLDGILANLLAAAKQFEPKEEQELDITCPNCGMTHAQFRETGLLGCAGCYQAFEEQLTPVMNRAHGAAQHVGRTPSNVGTDIGQKISIYTLKQQLQKAIAEEEYEQAAVLRDKIRELAPLKVLEEVNSHDGT